MTRSIVGLLVLLLLLVSLMGCAPQSGGQGAPPAGQDGLPELTKAVVDERINDTRVSDVLPESGTGEPIPWSFDEDEPKDIVIVDQKMDGSRATLVLDIKTQSAPRSYILRSLSGQIRTEWALQTGWALRRWEIVGTENISMKYRDLPKPSTKPENQAVPANTQK